MKLSVCTDAVFQSSSIDKAVYMLKELDISAIEFWAWENKNIEEIYKIKKQTGIDIVAFCTSMVSLVDEKQRETYLKSLKETIRIAKILGCKTLISQTGNDSGESRKKQHEILVEGLRQCVPILEKEDVTLVIEPLNVRIDHAGYYLWSSDEAAEIVKEVGSSNVKMLFDIYHQQITEGDLIRRITEYIPYIGHFHVAGNPGRHELYHSEVDYKNIISAIREMGYGGYIGLEYFPVDEIWKGIDYAKKVIS